MATAPPGSVAVPLSLGAALHLPAGALLRRSADLPDAGSFLMQSLFSVMCSKHGLCWSF